MKKEYKLNLHSNKIVNVLKCIVLIFAFFGVGVFVNAKEVEAETKCYEQQAVTYDSSSFTTGTFSTACGKSNIYFNSTVIRFHISEISAKSSDYKSMSDLKIVYYVKGSNTRQTVNLGKVGDGSVDQLDVEIYRIDTDRNGSKRKAGYIYYEYATSGGDWSGWKEHENFSFLSDDFQKNYNPNNLRFELNWGGSATYVGPYTVYAYRLVKSYIDVSGYYFSSPSLSVSETVNGRDVSGSYMKTHTPTIKVDGAAKDTVTIRYRWLDNFPGTDPWLNRSFVEGTTKVEGNISAKVSNPGDNLTGTKWLIILAEVQYGSSSDTLKIKKSIDFYFDNTAPTISFSYGSTSAGSWYQSVAVTLTFDDTGGSGVNTSTRQYCISTAKDSCTGGTWQTYSSVFLVSLDKDTYGTRYVHAKVFDNAGNPTTRYESRTIKIDKKGPTLLSSLGKSTWLTQDATTLIEYNDNAGYAAVNGIAHCWYLDSVESDCALGDYDDRVSDGALNVPYPTGTGKYHLKIKAKDSLGNESDVTKSTGTYWVDNSKPEFESAAENSIFEGKTATEHSVTVTFTDTESGISKLSYCWTKDYSTNCAYTDISYSSARMSVTETIKKSDGTGLYYLLVMTKDTYRYSEVEVLGPYSFDNSTPSFGLVKFSSDSSKASEVEISKVMSVEVEENVIEEEAFENIVVEEPLELVEVVPLANDVNVNELKQEYKEIVIKEEPKMLHIVSDIQYGVTIGGIYLFGRKRKRINVC